MTFWERAQNAQELIEKHDATWFIGCTVLVALTHLWGI